MKANETRDAGYRTCANFGREVFDFLVVSSRRDVARIMLPWVIGIMKTIQTDPALLVYDYIQYWNYIL